MTTEVPSIKEQLARPFGADEVKQRPGRGGGKFDYIDARSAHQRLDDVLGVGGWQTTYKVLDFESKAVECTLSAFIDGQWVVRTDVGYPNAADDADHDDREPYKAAYSDALKRAAVQFGVGRHLYGTKPAQRTREAPPSSPLTQQAFDGARLLAELTANGLTAGDLLPVTGADANGKPQPKAWLAKNPGKTIDDLVKVTVDTKQQIAHDELAGTTV